MDELRAEVQMLSDSEWSSFLAWVVTTEKRRRDALPAITQAQEELVVQLQESGKLEKPEAVTEEEAVENPDEVPEWQDPGTDHSKMYHYGDVVRFEGELVRSTHRGLNHWAPGTLSFDGRIWEKVGEGTAPVEEGDSPDPAGSEDPVPEYVQPAGGHDAYNAGDRVLFNGEVYESIIAGNVWTPEAYPAGWKKVIDNG